MRKPGRIRHLGKPANIFLINNSLNWGFQAIVGSHTELCEKISQRLFDLDPLIKQPNACNGELFKDNIHLFP
nr:hypothetical protein [Sodalis-like endosymbiont of Proechinophthirus fluctus]